MAESLLTLGLPATLYKYLPPERVDVLEDMELWFNRPSGFNDTFDTAYLVPRNQGLRAQAARHRLRSQLGVLCLTEQPNNHLMWVHYAQNHSGFVLGFDARASFFRDDERTLGKVKYQNRPNVLLSADVTACFCKSTDWSYEQEWRCARSFQASESRVVEIEPSLITHIIFGWRMEAWQITRIMQDVTAYEMTHTQLLLSSPLHTSWTFENRPKTMSVCPSCDGNGYLMKDRGVDSK
jgi:hypothetical protein